MSKDLNVQKQERLVQYSTLMFLNMNRTLPMLSGMKDPDLQKHLLLFGTANVQTLTLSSDASQASEAITELQKVDLNGFNVRSTQNPINIVLLPQEITKEFVDSLMGIKYVIPTIFVPQTMKSSALLISRMVVIPESTIAQDFTTASKMSFDGLKRLVKFLDEHQGWDRLENDHCVGEVAVDFHHGTVSIK